MAQLKAYSGLKVLCWRSTRIQQISHGACHLSGFNGLHKTRHYQRYSREVSTGQEHTVASQANRHTDEQDMSTNASWKNEDGDVFGSLAKKSYRPKKFQLEKSKSWKDTRLQSKDSTASKDLRNNETYAVACSSESWPSVFGTLAEEEENDSVMDSENKR